MDIKKRHRYLSAWFCIGMLGSILIASGCSRSDQNQAAVSAKPETATGVRPTPRCEKTNLWVQERGYAVPNGWRITSLCGRTFWHCIKPSDYWRNVGLAGKPFISEAASYGWQSTEGVLQKKVPVWGAGSAAREKYANPEVRAVYTNFIARAGEYFLGLSSANEWRPGRLLQKYYSEAEIKALAAKGRKQVAAAVETCFQKEYIEPTLGWFFAITPGFQYHLAYRLGARFGMPEIGSNTLLGNMQLAALRGAARQFNRPWGSYIAAFQPFCSNTKIVSGQRVIVDGIKSYSCRSPDERMGQKTMHKSGALLLTYGGPDCGGTASILMRLAWFSYMAGANVVFFESSGGKSDSIFIANYDWKRKLSPLTRILQDKVSMLSPMGEAVDAWYSLARTHDRGTPYTPVALLFDKDNGYVGGYGVQQAWQTIPYEDGDYMMRAVVNTIMPWEERLDKVRREDSAATKLDELNCELPGLVNTPFGEIFDMLTSDAPVSILTNYPALLMVGRVDVDKELAEKLVQYVEQGGTLIINTKQADECFPAEFLGVERVAGAKQAESIIWIDTGEVKEEKTFVYDVVRPVTARVAAKTALESDPLITVQNRGKGKVILTTPRWMMGKNKEAEGLTPEDAAAASRNMLALFSGLMKRVADEALPVRVSGDAQYMVNKSERGWIITLINNKGVSAKMGGIQMRPEERADIVLEYEGQARGVEEWLSGEKLNYDQSAGRVTVRVTVPPGGVKIVEIII